MTTLRTIRSETERLEAVFRAAGAQPIHTDILQPADTLLDLYGEDIRARAFVTHDPLRGEFMLRPDFTVPVVQMHMNSGAEPARYTYSGKVFRQQDGDALRASEYHQVGYEVFDRSNPSAIDAEVFSLIYKALQSVHVRTVTGDFGILKAAIQGLNTTEPRKSALLRHIWRPQRFRTLLDRFGGVTPVPESRKDLLGRADQMVGVGTVHGLRRADEIKARIETLRQDAAEPHISADERDLLLAILDLNGPSPVVLDQILTLARDMPALEKPVAGLVERLDALQARGIDVSALEFDASYGRRSMEYYDGFVFGFYRTDRPDLPPVATGGRYDALTSLLGKGQSVPAVGGVVRPGLLVEDAL